MAFAFGDETWPGIAKLSEECGEVVQVIGKLMMTHGDPVHWSGDLRQQLMEEMADVMAAVQFVGEICLTAGEREAIADRCAEKRAKFQRWHDQPEEDRPTPTDEALLAGTLMEGDHG